MRKVFSTIAAVAAFAASPAHAAVLLVNGSGQLTGATGVVVQDPRFDGVVSYSTYDVQFAEGSCSDLFGGCDQDSDFTMADLGGDSLHAYYAGQALIDQVLTGSFDTSPALTFGCGSPFFCQLLIPYHAEFGLFYASLANNSSGSDPDGVTSVTSFDKNYDTTNGPITFSNTTVYARFTLSAAPSVPEPSTWAMMLLGFGGIGVALRRRRVSRDRRPALTKSLRPS